MSQKNWHERLGGFFRALHNGLLPAICILVLILACLFWFFWPVSLEKAAGVAGEVQSIYVMDVSSPVLKPKEKIITDDDAIGDLLRIRLRRRVLSDDAVRDGWAYIIYLVSSDSRTEPIFLTERFVQIGNRYYVLLEGPAFVDFRNRYFGENFK